MALKLPAMIIDTIDLHFHDTPGIIAAFVVRLGADVVLIETGPGSCLPRLVSGLRQLGIEPGDIRNVFVTHIHLDHAGAAGWWAQQGATVHVHARGAPHLIDPAKLIDSASRIYGDRMHTLWGDILPAPVRNVQVMEDGEVVEVGGLRVIAWRTPGHARHHLAFQIGDVVFAGDVAGVRLQGCHYLSVAAAPPQFDPVAYVASVERLMSVCGRLVLTHYGEMADPQAHLHAYRERITEVHEKVRRWHAEGLPADVIARRYTESEHAIASAAGVSEADWERYERVNGTAMCADGIRLFCEKEQAAGSTGP